MRLAVRVNGGFQLGQVAAGRLLDLFFLELVLVGAGLQMRRVRVQHPAVNQLASYPLLHDLVEDLLIDRALGKTPPPILAEGRRIDNLIGQPEAEEPAVGHVHLDLTDQLPLRADPVEVAQKQHLEQHHRIDCRTTVVGAVEPLDLLPDELEVNDPVDFAQQMIPWNQFLDTNEFHPDLTAVMFS